MRKRTRRFNVLPCHRTIIAGKVVRWQLQLPISRICNDITVFAAMGMSPRS